MRPRGKGPILFVEQLNTWHLKLSKAGAEDTIRYVLVIKSQDFKERFPYNPLLNYAVF